MCTDVTGRHLTDLTKFRSLYCMYIYTYVCLSVDCLVNSSKHVLESSNCLQTKCLNKKEIICLSISAIFKTAR